MGRLQDLINSRLSEKQDSIKYFYGVLGNGSVVDVPGMPGYVYVTLNDGVITQAFNTLLPSILNFPVVVGYDKSQAGNDGILTVLSARNIPRVGSSAENSYAVRRHHASHEWMNENGGQDIVYVHTRQLMPLRPTPMGNWQLYIQPDVQYVNEQWQQVGGQLFNMYSRSINSYTSGSAGDERYTLVSLSLTSGSIVFTNGSIVAKGTSTLADIPDIPANNIPICAIRFWTGQTDIIEALTQTDLIDLRYKAEDTGASASEPFLTSGSSVLLSNYRQLKPGTNTSFDISIPNELTINTTGITTLSGLSDVSISGSQSPGEALIWDGSKWMPGTATSGSGGATALSDLSDVYISGSQSPGEALIWDGSKWMPGVVSGSGSGGATALSDLSDVYISGSQSNGQPLVWVSGSSKWMPGTATSGLIKQSVDVGDTLTIPPGYCYIVGSEFTVNGELDVSGELIVVG